MVLLNAAGKEVSVNIAELVHKLPGNGSGRHACRPELLQVGCHYIPEDHEREQGRKKRVTGYLQNACRQAGFSLSAGNTRPVAGGQIIKHKFVCSRHRRKVDSTVEKSKKQRQKTSSRPIEGESLCPFHFTLCEDTSSGKPTSRSITHAMIVQKQERVRFRRPTATTTSQPELRRIINELHTWLLLVCKLTYII